MGLIDWGAYILERILAYFGQGEPIAAWREKRQNLKENALKFDLFRLTFEKMFSSASEITSDKKLSVMEAAEEFVARNFSESRNGTRKALVLVLLCAYYKQYSTAETYGAIKLYAEMIGLSFHDLTESGKIFLGLYDSFRNSVKINFSDISKLHSADDKLALRDFANNYQKSLVLEFVSQQLAQSEELRKTLVEVIGEGKLSAFGITNRTIKSLDAKIKSKARTAKTFLIMANKLDDPQIKKYISAQPGFTGWAPLSKNITGKKNHRFSCYVFRPSEGFSSARELLAKFKSIAGTAHECLIGIFPIDGSEAEWFALPANKTFTNNNLTEALEVMTHFKTGSVYTDTDLWNELANSDVSVHELLSVIPFNIFAPGIYPAEREFLIKVHERLQSRLGVKTLSDWANVDPRLLCAELRKEGAPSYSVSEDSALGARKQKRLDEISESIISNAKKFKESLQLLGRSSI